MTEENTQSTLTFPERSHRSTDKVFTWDEVRALLDKETMRRAEYIAHILEALREEYGDRVLSIAKQAIYNIGYDKGAKRAELVASQGQANDLNNLAKLVSHDMAQLYLGNEVEVVENRMVVRETYCPLPRMWKEMGFPDEQIVGYCLLFDQVDKGMVEGYNPKYEAMLTGCRDLALMGFCQMVVQAKDKE
jgi:hypothetical protein